MLHCLYRVSLHTNNAHCMYTAYYMQDLPSARARAYDLVYNGVELGGGSLRIYRADVQRRVFEAIGLSEAEARAKFGYLLDSFQLGAPPHGGIALGVDRLVMLLAGTCKATDANEHTSYLLYAQARRPFVM